jgi:adenine-specific DNA methylase
MNLNLDEAAVRQAVSTALLDQLGVDGQRTLVAAALEFLVTPKKETWQRDPTSPLQEAFNQAVGAVAREIVRELVAENAEFRSTISTQVGEAFIKMEATNFTDYLGTALSEALRGDRH